MKIVFVVLAVALCYAHAELTPEQIEKFKEMLKECKEKTQVTEEDVALIKEHKLPESQTAKCFSACIKKKLGIMDADNKVNMARVTELMEHVKEKDEAKYDAMIKVFETCAAEVPGGDDECEVAYKITECCIREFKENGITIDYMSIFHKSR